jgi:hypothetical protein
MDTSEKNPKENWSSSSWKKFKISQQPIYPDQEKVKQITEKVCFYKLDQ